MNFASDNVVGASRRVLEAIMAANEGAEASYGVDHYTRRAEAMLADLFEHDVCFAKRIDPALWRQRPWRDRVAQWAVSRARYLL